MNEKIAIIGSGLMGHGIAQIFAAQGYSVTIIDPHAASLKTVPERVRSNLRAMMASGVAFSSPVDEIVSRIRLSTKMEPNAEEANFVIEAVFEDMPLKQQIFFDLDRLCPPETILCSNIYTIIFNRKI